MKKDDKPHDLKEVGKRITELERLISIEEEKGRKSEENYNNLLRKKARSEVFQKGKELFGYSKDYLSEKFTDIKRSSLEYYKNIHIPKIKKREKVFQDLKISHRKRNLTVALGVALALGWGSVIYYNHALKKESNYLPNSQKSAINNQSIPKASPLKPVGIKIPGVPTYGQNGSIDLLIERETKSAQASRESKIFPEIKNKFFTINGNDVPYTDWTNPGAKLNLPYISSESKPIQSSQNSPSQGPINKFGEKKIKEVKSDVYFAKKGFTMELFARKNYNIDPLKDKKIMKEFYKVNGKDYPYPNWVNSDGTPILTASKKNPNYVPVGTPIIRTPLDKAAKKQVTEPQIRMSYPESDLNKSNIYSEISQLGVEHIGKTFIYKVGISSIGQIFSPKEEFTFIRKSMPASWYILEKKPLEIRFV